MKLHFNSVAITPAMKCCRRRSCSDNKFDSADGALLATGSGLPQFQIGMDRETKFQLWIEVQKMRGRNMLQLLPTL